MSTYYRTIAYLMRAMLVMWLIVAGLIPFGWWRTGEPFPDNWWVLYVAGIPVIAILWFASKAILRLGSRSK